MADKYASFDELVRHEVQGRDYRIDVEERRDSSVLVIAPHGGTTEAGTSELAALIAGREHNLYVFEGLKPGGKYNGLHVTSHRFDEPACLALASRCSVVIAVHGCIGKSQVYVGGLDSAFARLLTLRLRTAGFPATAEGHDYPGRHPLNICNRGSLARGVQLEFTTDFRAPPLAARIAAVVRSALAEYLAGQRAT
jgi:phage replication-related protein YjqB (UPF0714/DUF867 family)